MANKRKRHGEGNEMITSSDELRNILSSAVTTHQSAEMAILHLIDEYDISIPTLQRAIQANGLNVSFSQVKLREIAPFVGLDPCRFLKDIGTFELHRSRIPTDLFKSIVQDMDLMLMQYGPLTSHKTEEATSRFLSPIFNRLIPEFGFAYRNLPESIIKGHISTNGRIEHYLRAFGSISVLIVEVKLKVGDDDERLDAIAQVIAECNACDWNNSELKFALPVYGILWDGTSFQFFKFKGDTKPYSFQRGAFSGDPPNQRKGLKLPELIPGETAFPFIESLRHISETIFDLLLCNYISSIVAFRDRFVDLSMEEGARRKGLDKWEDAQTFAQQALHQFRDAETKRQNKDVLGATQAVVQAQTTLKHSVDIIPIINDDDNVLLIASWDDEDIELA